MTTKQVTRVYSGKPGCMCGCRGNYSENERAIKSLLTRMSKVEAGLGFIQDGLGDEKIVGIETPTRTYAVYYKAVRS